MNAHRQAHTSDSLAFFTQKESLHAYPVHSHARFYVFARVDRGSIACFGKPGASPLPGNTASAGDLIVINPEQAHSGYPADGKPYSYRALYINRNYLALLFGRQTPPHFSPSIIRAYKGQGEFDTCFRNPQADEHIPFFQTGRTEDSPEEPLLLFLSHLLDLGLFEEGETSPGDMAHCVKYIKAHTGEKLTLDRMARDCAMSKFHLVRRFTAETGITPLHFHTQERISQAKALLKSGRDIADVALVLGFYDQSHFQNIFKSFTGLTPRQYLKGQHQ
ncbi:MAG: helix-turn-helix transcriptional regulator [Spirochaetales bacterium]|nr:helix-turn-helix transcriptional regulator [Spirochaetales bacterium]